MRDGPVRLPGATLTIYAQAFDTEGPRYRAPLRLPHWDDVPVEEQLQWLFRQLAPQVAIPFASKG